MIKPNDNAIINAKLSALYEEYAEDFLKEWVLAFPDDVEGPPCRINEFGIIDINNYDSDNGILFICRETNNWENKHFAEGVLFRNWMHDIACEGLANRGHITKHPNMWYNIGRWIMLLTEPERKPEEIVDVKSEAISAIGKIAFTNVNKVRGKKVSKKEYFKLASNPLVKELLRKEIEIINPKIIVCCGTARPSFPLPKSFTGEVYVMAHPGARTGNLQMLLELKQQTPIRCESGECSSVLE